MKLKGTYLGLLIVLILAASGSIEALAQEPVDTLLSESSVADSTLSEQGPEAGLSIYTSRFVTRFKKSHLLITILYSVILYSIVTLITLLIIILLHRRRLEREELLNSFDPDARRASLTTPASW